MNFTWVKIMHTLHNEDTHHRSRMACHVSWPHRIIAAEGRYRGGGKKKAANPTTLLIPISQPCKNTLIKNPSVVYTTEGRGWHILPYWFSYSWLLNYLVNVSGFPQEWGDGVSWSNFLKVFHQKGAKTKINVEVHKSAVTHALQVVPSLPPWFILQA